MNKEKLIHELKKALAAKKFKNAIIILESDERTDFALAGDPIELISKIVDFSAQSDDFFEIAFSAMIASAKNKGINIFDKEFVEAIKAVEATENFETESKSENKK